MIRTSASVLVLLLWSGAASALVLEDCVRKTHPSHGGERAQQDFGAGWVGFTEWWSQEGVYTDLVVANCDTGETLRTRVREERITNRAPFDRTRLAQGVIARHMDSSPAFFDLNRLARDLGNTGKDIEIFASTQEHCACAALYPDLRADKAPFEEAE